MKFLIILIIIILNSIDLSTSIKDSDYDCIININNNNGSDTSACGFINNNNNNNNNNCSTINGAINSLENYLKTKTCNYILINIQAGRYYTNDGLNLVSGNLFNLPSFIKSVTFFGSTFTIIDGTNTNSSFLNLQDSNSTLTSKSIPSISFESINFENWNGTESTLFIINQPSSNYDTQVSIIDCNFSNINSSSIFFSKSKLIGKNTNTNVEIQNSQFTNINTLSSPFNFINTDLVIYSTNIQLSNITSGSFFNIQDSNFYFSNSIINQVSLKQHFITSTFTQELELLFGNSTYTNNSLGFLNSTFLNINNSSNNNNNNNNSNNNRISIINSSFINNHFTIIGDPLFMIYGADLMIMNINVSNTGDHIAGDEFIIGNNSLITIWNSSISSFKPIYGYNLNISLFSNNQIDNSTFCFFCLDCNFQVSNESLVNSTNFKPLDLNCSSIGRSKRIWIRFALFLVITFILLFALFYNLYQKFKVCNLQYFKVSRKKNRLLNDDDDDDDDNNNYNNFSIL